MQKQAELNFSVEGHTDSDGDETLNQTLSEARAKAVMERLISMGISANRLKSAGFGESKPLYNNSTPEGKANNRRVEFVKFTENRNSAKSNSKSTSLYNELNLKSIDTKIRTLEAGNIEVSNSSGVLLENGTTILYATSDGNLGKMKIIDIDKNDSYRLTVKYVTYNGDGSIHSQSDYLEVGGTYTCDLDKGTTKDVINSDEDFWLNRASATETSIVQRGNAIFCLYP